MSTMPRYNNSRCCNMPNTSTCCEPVMTMTPPHNHHHHDHLHSLAVAFVINQPMGSEAYDVPTALMKGTIYPDLYKPYTGRGRCN